MLELVIFDADGVLFDSDESNTAYYNAIFKQLGLQPLAPEEERAGVFMAATQVFAMRAGNDRELLARMHAVGETLDNTPFFELLRPPFELRPFLLDLRNRYRLALATNRSATIPALVHHLELADLFDAVACARDKNVRPKPAPDIVELCMRRAGVEPHAAVYVGDSPIDREAAQAAGAHFIGVGRRIDGPNHIEHLAELPAALARTFGE